eukprot:6471486-Amphidinium_carterae.2
MEPPAEGEAPSDEEQDLEPSGPFQWETCPGEADAADDEVATGVQEVLPYHFKRGQDDYKVEKRLNGKQKLICLKKWGEGKNKKMGWNQTIQIDESIAPRAKRIILDWCQDQGQSLDKAVLEGIKAKLLYQGAKHGKSLAEAHPNRIALQTCREPRSKHTS